MTVGLNVVTYNEAHRITTLLHTVAPWVDECVVVDQTSTDDTARLAAACGATVITDTHHGYGDPSRPLAESHTHADWVLALDADEHPASGFLAALGWLTAGDIDSYRLTRVNLFGGQWWSTEQSHHLRLFRRGTVAWHPGVHRQPSPVDAARCADLPPVAILHEKRWSEQLLDDTYYERLTGKVGPFLAVARATGVDWGELDGMPVAEARALGFDCAAVRGG